MTDGAPDPGLWELKRFRDALDNWRAHEQPDPTRLAAVLAWMDDRRRDPFEGCRQDPRIPDLWFAEVRGTATAATVVVCSFLVDRAGRVLTCDNLATLGRPVIAGEWDPAWEPPDD